MTSVLWESITTLQTPQESRSSYYSRDPPRGASLFDPEEIVAFDTFCSYEDGDANKQTTIISSVRSSYSHPDLLVIQHHHPLFQITPVLNTGLSLSEPLELYKGYNAI